MNITQINSAIMQGQLTNDELTSVIDAVKFARARLNREVKSSLMVGDNVEFTSSKTGRAMRGFVTKVAIKYVTCEHGCRHLASAGQHADSCKRVRAGVNT